MNNQPTPPAPKQPDASGEPQPVAYDNQGRPLYHAPPVQPVRKEPPQEPQFVHFSRAVAPEGPSITPEVKKRHDESVKRYPYLNLSEAEFVISAVRRHPIGLALPVGMAVFLVALTASVMINYPVIQDSMGMYTAPSMGSVLFIGLLFILLVLIGCYISVWIYMSNKFFLTNESVIQEIQASLFSHHEQTVSLANIEDASYKQQGVIQLIFNYGSIRLSTEGDETTYRFSYVANPKDQIATLNNAVEAFKNGRPITDD